MNKKFAIVQTILFLFSIGMECYSYYGFVRDTKIFGDTVNAVTGMFIGYWILVAIVAWHFWEMHQEVLALKEKFPNVIFKECGIDNMLANTNRYGACSLLCRGISFERTLLYLDFLNSPKTKINNDAIGICVRLTYYNKDRELVARKHFGRWMEMPETEFKTHIKTNIPPDGETIARLGVGYFDKGGNGCLTLLDAETIDLNRHGYLNSDDVQYLDHGKYFVLATVSGSFIQPNINSLLFSFEIGKDKILEFKQERDIKEFLKKVKEKKNTSFLWGFAKS